MFGKRAVFSKWRSPLPLFKGYIGNSCAEAPTEYTPYPELTQRTPESPLQASPCPPSSTTTWPILNPLSHIFDPRWQGETKQERMSTWSHSRSDAIFRKRSGHPEVKNQTQGGRGGLPFTVVDQLPLPMMMYHPHPCPPPPFLVTSGDLDLL